MSDSEEDPQLTQEEEQKQDNDLTNDRIVEKYKSAANIAEAALKHVVSLVAVDAKVVDLCNAGDAYVNEAVAKVYGKPKVEKGSAFPTCVSVNSTIGHFCPLSGDETVLALGDLIKIDLAVHIDGYIACLAHTVLLDESGTDGKITGRKADVMLAAWTAAEAALRLLKPSKINADISTIIGQCAEEFKCTPVQGVLSHQIERFIIDGDKVILNKPDLENKVEDHEFETSEAYCIDIVMSTAEGKARESEYRTTVYKRAADANYQLKMKASRAIYSQILKETPTFPFTIRALDEKKAKFAITELAQHEMVHTYPVLVEQEGEYIAHIKFTALILPHGTVKITGNNLINPANLQSEYSVQDKDLKALLATSAGGKKKKKKNKKKKGKKTE